MHDPTMNLRCERHNYVTLFSLLTIVVASNMVLDVIYELVLVKKLTSKLEFCLLKRGLILRRPFPKLIQSWPGLVERPWKDLPAFLVAVKQRHDHPEVGWSTAAQHVAGEPWDQNRKPFLPSQTVPYIQ